MINHILDNVELKIIQQHLESVSGNVLLCSNDSKTIDLISSENLQVLSNSDKTISDHIDNLLLTNSFEENKKFDTIIIHDLFEQIKNPELFIQHLDSVLNNNGIIICSISNFSYINNIFNLLIGNIDNNFFNTSRFYDLNNFLLFLNKNNMHITKLTRVKQDFSSESMNLDDTLIPSQLIEMYQQIPDHDVTQYVFMIGKGKSVSSETLDFSSQFPKNYLLPKLKEFFEKFTEFKDALSKKDKVIEGLENSIKDITGYSGSALSKKDKVIEGYEKSIQDLTSNAVPALSKKDKVIEGLEHSIDEHKTYTGTALSKKDKVIEGLENSIAEHKTYTETALSKKDKVIEGLENSIAEQKDFLKNLKTHNEQLESQLKKFKFWRR
jgi:hypothetical protein